MASRPGSRPRAGRWSRGSHLSREAAFARALTEERFKELDGLLDIGRVRACRLPEEAALLTRRPGSVAPAATLAAAMRLVRGDRAVRGPAAVCAPRRPSPTRRRAGIVLAPDARPRPDAGTGARARATRAWTTMREALLTVWNPFADELLEAVAAHEGRGRLGGRCRADLVWRDRGRGAAGPVPAPSPPPTRCAASTATRRRTSRSCAPRHPGRGRRARSRPARTGCCGTPSTACWGRHGGPGAPRHAAVRAAGRRGERGAAHVSRDRPEYLVARLAALAAGRAASRTSSALLRPGSAAECHARRRHAGRRRPTRSGGSSSRALAGAAGGAGRSAASCPRPRCWPSWCRRSRPRPSRRAVRATTRLRTADGGHLRGVPAAAARCCCSNLEQPGPRSTSCRGCRPSPAPHRGRRERRDTRRRCAAPLGELALDAFPATLLPEPARSPSSTALAARPGSTCRVTEELAADIFEGRFARQVPARGEARAASTLRGHRSTRSGTAASTPPRWTTASPRCASGSRQARHEPGGVRVERPR